MFTKPQWKERIEELLKNYDASRNLEELVTKANPISTWEDYRKWIASFPGGGYFRGHREESWKLDSTLDRAVRKTRVIKTEDISAAATEKLNFAENEKQVLLDFQRGAHNSRRGCRRSTKS